MGGVGSRHEGRQQVRSRGSIRRRFAFDRHAGGVKPREAERLVVGGMVVGARPNSVLRESGCSDRFVRTYRGPRVGKLVY